MSTWLLFTLFCCFFNLVIVVRHKNITVLYTWTGRAPITEGLILHHKYLRKKNITNIIQYLHLYIWCKKKIVHFDSLNSLDGRF